MSDVAEYLPLNGASACITKRRSTNVSHLGYHPMGMVSYTWCRHTQ